MSSVNWNRFVKALDKNSPGRIAQSNHYRSNVTTRELHPVEQIGIVSTSVHLNHPTTGAPMFLWNVGGPFGWDSGALGS